MRKTHYSKDPKKVNILLETQLQPSYCQGPIILIEFWFCSLIRLDLPQIPWHANNPIANLPSQASFGICTRILAIEPPLEMMVIEGDFLVFDFLNPIAGFLFDLVGFDHLVNWKKIKASKFINFVFKMPYPAPD